MASKKQSHGIAAQTAKKTISTYCQLYIGIHKCTIPFESAADLLYVCWNLLV